MNRCFHTQGLIRLALAGVVVTAIGCKGDTVVKPDPHTEAELEKCKKDKLELETYKTKLESENAALMQKGSGDQIIVTIEATS